MSNSLKLTRAERRIEKALAEAREKTLRSYEDGRQKQWERLIAIWPKDDTKTSYIFYHVCLFNGGVLGFRPQFFDIQDHRASVYTVPWPRYNQATVLHQKNILRFQPLGPSLNTRERWPNVTSPVDGIYYAEEFCISRETVAPIKSELLTKAWCTILLDRQLVELPRGWIDSLSYFTLAPKSRRIVRAEALEEDDALAMRRRPANSTMVSKVRFRRESLSWLRLNRKPPCVDLEAVYNAMLWFDWPRSFTNCIRIPSFYPSRLSRLPLEIQLQILYSLPLKYVHRAVTDAFPMLVNLHLGDITFRFKAWLSEIFSRDNMKYVGTTKRESMVVEIYRLRSEKYHHHWRKVSVTSCSPLPDIQPFAPSLQSVQAQLAISIEQYFWSSLIFWEYKNPRENIVPDPHSEGKNRVFPPRLPDTNLASDIEREVFPLIADRGKHFSMRGFAIDLDRYQLRTTKPVTELGDQYKYETECVGQVLYLLEEELADILEDFKYFVRPKVFVLRNLDHQEKLTEYPRGVPLLSQPEARVWQALAHDLLTKFVLPEHPEEIFWESWADTRFLFNIEEHGEEEF